MNIAASGRHVAAAESRLVFIERVPPKLWHENILLFCACFVPARKHTKQDSTMNEEWKSMFGSQEPPTQPATVTNKHAPHAAVLLWLVAEHVCGCSSGSYALFHKPLWSTLSRYVHVARLTAQYPITPSGSKFTLLYLLHCRNNHGNVQSVLEFNSLLNAETLAVDDLML